MKILGTGSYLPPKVVTNDDLARSLDTSDEWIHSHTGIHSRHIAGADDCTSTMAVKAAKKAMEAAGVTFDTLPDEEIAKLVEATKDVWDLVDVDENIMNMAKAIRDARG